MEERKILQAAKKVYFEIYGQGPIIHRNKLNQIKARLKEESAATISSQTDLDNKLKKPSFDQDDAAR